MSVSLAVVVRNGKVLALRRGPTAPSMPGYWECPGGHSDGNETLEETALRELKEETGLTGTIKYKLGIFRGAISGFRCHVYRVDVPEDEKITVSWEHDAMQWVGTEEEVSPSSNIFREILAAVKTETEGD